jgi:hypothetical protein
MLLLKKQNSFSTQKYFSRATVKQLLGDDLIRFFSCKVVAELATFYEFSYNFTHFPIKRLERNVTAISIIKRLHVI